MGSISSSEKCFRYVLKPDVEVSYPLFLPNSCREHHIPLGQLKLYHFLERLIGIWAPNTKSSLEFIVLYLKWHLLVFTSKQFFDCYQVLTSFTLLPSFFPYRLFLLYVLIDTGPLFNSFLPPNSIIKLPSLCFFFIWPLWLKHLRFPQVLCSPSFHSIKLGTFVPSVHYISFLNFLFSSKLGLDSECHMFKNISRDILWRGDVTVCGRKKRYTSILKIYTPRGSGK